MEGIAYQYRGYLSLLLLQQILEGLSTRNLKQNRRIY